ncbi:LysM peptidoglycan-binding domain-containing protein [Vannielia litorea]|uniref:Nucleoid-associated protein YgaU, contains BON and LysM domains n=1 Tax=Vannielia litorea TaxID=1217970 RepID=A0A1N6H198_9RHOB|nr:LysM peptidoglycan-binding domain-containing protein [Vannielia litorea]SIO13472.1 Nucleoid-associated protein YgaU, contains BON and LysM domains [Vannielia litorea]
MFRALVTASALLTATLAAVLFVPGVGRERVDTSGGIASTGDMMRSGGLVTMEASEASVMAPAPATEPEVVAEAEAVVEPAPVAEVVEAPEPEVPEAESSAETGAEVAEAAPGVDADALAADVLAALSQSDVTGVEGPLADEVALAATVALSALAMPEEALEAEAETPRAQTADDMRALSAGVLAGLGLELPTEPAPPPAPVSAQRRFVTAPSSQRALEEAAGWSTDYVLIGLGLGPRKVTTPLEDAQEWSTAYVLRGLEEAGAGPRPVATGGPVTLEEVIATAMEEGRSEEYLVALIDELSAAGQLEAPAALLRPDGQVDSRLVLNALVTASTVAARKSAGPETRPARRLSKPVTYTVREGDSLASIAYRFYGITSRYTVIFEANRGTLPSPDHVKAGQRLTIPAG